jgi:hypothetical protein
MYPSSQPIPSAGAGSRSIALTAAVALAVSLVSFQLAVTPQGGVPASPSSGERSQQLHADSDPSPIVWRGR